MQREALPPGRPLGRVRFRRPRVHALSSYGARVPHASYEYAWQDLDHRSLAMHGLMCRLDRDGVEHFNFPQAVWLYPRVVMRATARFTRAAEVLAVNMLTLALPERDYRAYIGLTSSRALHFARPFAEDCLLDLPRDAWCIPLHTLRHWVAVKTPSKRAAR